MKQNEHSFVNAKKFPNSFLPLIVWFVAMLLDHSDSVCVSIFDIKNFSFAYYSFIFMLVICLFKFPSDRLVVISPLIYSFSIDFRELLSFYRPDTS